MSRSRRPGAARCFETKAAAPAAGGSPRTWRGRPAPPPGPRLALRPRARERRPGRIRCAGPSAPGEPPTWSAPLTTCAPRSFCTSLGAPAAPADTGAELLMRYEPSDHLARTKIKRTPPARTALAALPAHVTRLKAHSCGGDEKAPGTDRGQGVLDGRGNRRATPAARRS